MRGKPKAGRRGPHEVIDQAWETPGSKRNMALAEKPLGISPNRAGRLPDGLAASPDQDRGLCRTRARRLASSTWASRRSRTMPDL